MLKKLIFVSLMSGVALSPKGAYAMDDEREAPKTLISGPASSIQQSASSSQQSVDEPVPPISVPDLIILPGEHLFLQDDHDHWTNNARTIVLPATTIRPSGPYISAFEPLVFVDGIQYPLFKLAGDLGGAGSLMPMFSAKQRIANHPGIWKGLHRVFVVSKSGSIDTFPYIECSAAPASRPELEVE